MWALVENNLVTQVYTRPKAITIGDVNYPSNIFMLWSSSELEAIGIYEVVVDNSNYKDPGYYINTNQTFAFAKRCCHCVLWYSHSKTTRRYNRPRYRRCNSMGLNTMILPSLTNKHTDFYNQTTGM
jgi:hypothetical protein